MTHKELTDEIQKFASGPNCRIFLNPVGAGYPVSVIKTILTHISKNTLKFGVKYQYFSTI